MVWKQKSIALGMGGILICFVHELRQIIQVNMGINVSSNNRELDDGSPYFHNSTTIKLTNNTNNTKSTEVTVVAAAEKQRGRFMMGCADIVNLEIIRVVGTGKHKIAYEVKLPWGEHGVVKRCLHYRCIRAGKPKQEAKLLQALQEQYGHHATQFYGHCDAPTLKIKRKRKYVNRSKFNEHAQENLSNFAVGYTSVSELGTPLLSSWETEGARDRKCFAEFFTENDIEDLRNIARRYATFTESPLLMTLIDNYSDNIFPQQYIAGIGGGANGRAGIIKHIDLDFVFSCKKRYGTDRNCTVDEVLDVNCQVMSKLTNLPDLDCSLPADDADGSRHRQQTPYKYGTDRINVSHAAMECRQRNNAPYNTSEERKPHFFWRQSNE